MIVPEDLRHGKQKAKDLGLSRCRDCQRGWGLRPPGAGSAMPVVIVRHLVAGRSAASTSRRSFDRRRLQDAATRGAEQLAFSLNVENGHPLLDLPGRRCLPFVEPADLLILTQS